MTRRYYLAVLLARTAVFVALVWYALADPAGFARTLPWRWTPVTVSWLALMASMVFRLFPSRWESIGSQKLYARVPSSAAAEEIRQANRGALRVLAAWLALNGLLFLGQARGWLGRRFLICAAGFYGVCDIVCILFFCPFQQWMMHNRCCAVCRIFDWDYLMLCTPLLGVGGPLALSALALSAVIFLRWEAAWHLHPERFLESANAALRCGACQEQLCRYKRGLRRILPKGRE